MTTIRQIQTRKEIRNHLLYIYQSQPNITISHGNLIQIKINRLIYSLDRSDEILLRTEFLPSPPALAKVGITYLLGGFEHYFESRVISIKPVENTGTFFKINLPSDIRAVNRRSYLRFYPDCNNIIQVRLNLPARSPMTCSVQDISAGGFSFLAPVDLGTSLSQPKMDVELRLPGDICFSVAAVFRNMLMCGNELRIGAEFTNILKKNKILLTKYIVNRLMRNKPVPEKIDPSQHPLICLIQDNFNSEEALAYLEQPYRLVRQNLKADWKLMARVSPDVLLFNLNSISPIALLPKIRALPNLKCAPAIILADDESLPACDATVLCQLKDPAMLIDAVENTITKKITNNLNSLAYSKLEAPETSTTSTILVLDLNGNISSEVIAGVESRGYGSFIVTQLVGILDTIKTIKPVLIVIAADFDTTLTNLVRMLNINKHTRSIPLAILVDSIGLKRVHHRQPFHGDIPMLPNDMNPGKLTQHLIDLITSNGDVASNQL